MFKKLSPRTRLFVVLGLLSLSSIAYLAANLKPASAPVPVQPTPTPAAQITSKDPQISALKPEKYSYAADFVSFPSQSNLPVYSATISNQSFLSPISQQLITAYKLSPSSSSKNYYYSSGKSIILIFDSDNQYVSFSYDGMENPNLYLGKNPPKLEAAISSAASFLKQFSSIQSLAPQRSQISFYKVDNLGSEPRVVSDPNQASLIKIPFSFGISGIPYRYSSATAAPVQITVGQNNQVLQAYFTSQPLPKLSDSKEYRLLTSEEVLSALNNNQGTVIYAPLYYLPGKTTQLPPVVINSIQLEYRLDPQLNKVLPYYLINGSVHPTETSSEQIIVQILLPAVKYP